MKEQSQFLTIVEKDKEGSPAGMLTLQRSHVVNIKYLVVYGVLQVVLTSYQTTSGIKQIPVLNKEGKQTQAVRDTLVTVSKSETIEVFDEANIVLIYNWLNGTEHTVEDFPGFEYHRNMITAIKAAAEKKKAEEEANKSGLIINPNDNETRTEGGIILPNQ